MTYDWQKWPNTDKCWLDWKTTKPSRTESSVPYLFFAKKEKCLQIKGMFKHLSGYLSVVVAQSCLTLLRPHGLQPFRLLCPWNSPGKNTEVGYHSLLQGIFPLQGSNLGLLHCRQILYHLNFYKTVKSVSLEQVPKYGLYMAGVDPDEAELWTLQSGLQGPGVLGSGVWGVDADSTAGSLLLAPVCTMYHKYIENILHIRETQIYRASQVAVKLNLVIRGNMLHVYLLDLLWLILCDIYLFDLKWAVPPITSASRRFGDRSKRYCELFTMEDKLCSVLWSWHCFLDSWEKWGPEL